MSRRSKDALEDCQRALSLDPSSLKALLRGAKCNFVLGNLSEADRLYTRVSSVEPNLQENSEYKQLRQVQNYIFQAETYLENAQYGLAINAIDRAVSPLEVIPNKLKIMKGEALLGQKEYAEATRIANEVLRGDPRNSDAHVLRARILYIEGDNKKSIAHCQEALRFEPDHSSARVLRKKAQQIEDQKNAGNDAFSRGDYFVACGLYTSALEVDPTNTITNSKIYSNRALVLMKQGKYADAVKDMDKALELDPTFIKVLRRRADAYLKLERYQDAVNDLRAAMDLDSSNREIRRELQNAERELKRASRKDYYKILGVPRDASEIEIKKAYRKLALQHHPDKNCGDSDAEIKFKEIGEAYAILGDPMKKQRYDSGVDLDGMNGGMNFDSVDPNLFFQMFMNENFASAGGGSGGFRTHTYHFG
ncbi:13859_t:CDS:2 [Acaulospora colombiana]|uniref:13859_t:CDS:1 n=1 Tax=Acaulospora colombiana TaxID=27376 RepID=A0ACA9LS93_9GLOM|nr:13859_t:CDS:2 [Acaulospora colombiana]